VEDRVRAARRGDDEIRIGQFDRDRVERRGSAADPLRQLLRALEFYYL
jgi:hypothetical protein